MYAVSNKYKETIYSGDAKHRLNISFLPNADTYCEKLTIKPRIIPNGNKNFTLDNFVSKEAELVLRDLSSLSVIQDQFTISLTTSDRRETFSETVPLGVFNISDKPTTDKNKTTIKLYDNAIKFDFNYDGRQFELTSDTIFQRSKNYYLSDGETYTVINFPFTYERTTTIDGETVTETITVDIGDEIPEDLANIIYQLKSSWTKKDILLDICSKAGVNTKVTTFLGENDTLQIWDNTITARTYISYIAEQAGAIATIDRDGELIFVYLGSLQTERIPLWVVEKYELGKSYEIGRVVYEDGIRKFAYPLNEVQNKDILFINASNPYIYSQEQIESVYGLVNGFKIDSLKTGKILGNPAVDPYDYIEIYDSYSQNEETIAKTLATYTMVYNGVLISTYDTQIGEESRTENMSLKDTSATTKRYIKSVIDPVQGSIDLMAGEIWGDDGTGETNGLHFDMYGTTGIVKNATGDISTLRQDVNGLELDVKKHGDNILMGTDLYDDSKWGLRQVSYVNSKNPPKDTWFYWYCTETNGAYQNGVIYRYDDYTETWVSTELTRKDLEGDKINTGISIVNNSVTANNFISQRALEFYNDEAGSGVIANTATENYFIDRTKNNITFSCKIENSLKNARFDIFFYEMVGNKDEVDIDNNGTTLQYIYSIYADEMNNLTELSYTIPIVSKANTVEGYYGSTAPNNYNYWLNSDNSDLYQKNANGEWVEITGVGFHGLNNDKYYFPNFVHARYPDASGEPFENWYYLESDNGDLDTSFISMEFAVQLYENETKQDGKVLIGDIKLEYGEVATDWTNNYNEVYGKNYRLDDKGFKISKADNELFLDEDELTGKYKGDVMFQINGDRVFSKNGVFETTNQNGLITKKLSNGMYVRYIED